jgi:branched-chain amino acid aminotransferase
MATSKAKAELDWAHLPFSYIKTDANIRFDYLCGGWSDGKLLSDDSINISIASPALHYGQQAFEGLKAFETKDGSIVSFRPDENAVRMNRTNIRIGMPEIPKEMFLNAVKDVVLANSRFVPPYGTGASLYIRPLIIGTGPKVGLGPADEYIFLIFVTPVGPYYKGGFKPVEALVVEEFDRAAPQGVGDCKVGGNYAAGLPASFFVKNKGFSVGLFLDPKEKKFIDEFSTSNFIAIKGDTYITPLSNSILPSITNKSLASIAESIGMKVERRPVDISEIEEFDEIGAVGTAAVITPISAIQYKDKTFTYGSPDKAGPVLTKLYDTLTRIQTGDAPDPGGWLYKID